MKHHVSAFLAACGLHIAKIRSGAKFSTLSYPLALHPLPASTDYRGPAGLIVSMFHRTGGLEYEVPTCWRSRDLLGYIRRRFHAERPAPRLSA